MDGTVSSEDTTVAKLLVPAPKADEGVHGSSSSSVPPTGNGEGAPLPKENPFDQYYSQLTHQQNMLQDSVRVTAYQKAILENAADFKVRPHREAAAAARRGKEYLLFSCEVGLNSSFKRGLVVMGGWSPSGGI